MNDGQQCDPKEQALKRLINEMQMLMVDGKGDQPLEPGAVADAAAGGEEDGELEELPLGEDGDEMVEEDEEGQPAGKGEDFKDDVRNFMKFGGKPKPASPGTKVVIRLAGGGGKAPPAAAKAPPFEKTSKRRGGRGVKV